MREFVERRVTVKRSAWDLLCRVARVRGASVASLAGVLIETAVEGSDYALEVEVAEAETGGPAPDRWQQRERLHVEVEEARAALFQLVGMADEEPES